MNTKSKKNHEINDEYCEGMEVSPAGAPPWLGVERVGVPLAESSYFATFADSSCCVALSASVLALSAKKIQKVTIKFALFQQVQLF